MVDSDTEHERDMCAELTQDAKIVEKCVMLFDTEKNCGQDMTLYVATKFSTTDNLTNASYRSFH